jgi:hypothetical protein
MVSPRFAIVGLLSHGDIRTAGKRQRDRNNARGISHIELPFLFAKRVD